MVKVGNVYNASDKHLWQVKEVTDTFIAATYGMGVPGLVSYVHHFDRNGRLFGSFNEQGQFEARNGVYLLLGNDLPLDAEEQGWFDETVETAPDFELSMFCHRYDGLMRTLYQRRGIEPEWMGFIHDWSHKTHRRRVLEALNSGRRVMLFAIEDHPDVWQEVKKKCVRNGSYVFKGENWQPLDVDWPAPGR